ncbi:type II toxin-antitoxin system RelE/ParE family toxin [Candidatus Woesearchaeota archaeon]|jgi:mRNA interferase RelE/StbE|nr:type II toxin-antitoxin system RelE/ParE family toxin [Candidatus Woesearchaeota archaeon]MBT7062885.1 type II toxin-antitoxin system RelE/ParE family toxin [Candidatus Woesearchaeota archaeon]MBT7402709.1 type II toxin-antitoxin system RelE/ParE family toxin [Candidatus Woesearchaeota archaeon]
MYKIKFSDKSLKQIRKLEKKDQERIIITLNRIKIRPEHYIEKLVDDPAYKLRVGNYRVLMDLDKGNLLIIVIKVGHRKKIYKN